ncbi:MAG: hypothetical protein FJX72_01295 [Armatimonadetes bacterium]|nr:hypothetical protein [Armatimonadota bacterium]
MGITIGMAVPLLAVTALGAPPSGGPTQTPQTRAMRFEARTRSEAQRWQERARAKLYALMMGGAKPDRVPIQAQIVRRIQPPNAPYTLEEVKIQSLTDRRAHLWIATPKTPKGRHPAVLAIHGHGGTGEQIVRGQSLYWYGRALAEMGYVVIAPDVGQHDLQHPTWSLMGERTWDCIRALDYACARPDVDPSRLAVCGLSLGGETAMYVAALDTRVKAANSSGWLTTVANMRNGHCVCFDFPGLGENFDFSDIFGCIAPRPLVCEIGERERAPGGFPLSIATQAFDEIRHVYGVFGAEQSVRLTAHPYGHVYVGYDFAPVLRRTIGEPLPWKVASSESGRLAIRGEIASRCFGRAVGVLKGWWATRDTQYGLLPRRTDEPVWAPSDNAADLMPFLFLTDHYTGAGYTSGLLGLLESERRLTNRDGVLPDWFSMKTGTWVHREPDLQRMIFCAAEYCKDGLMPMTEAMGKGPWSTRMLELLDAVIERAPVATAFGRIPAADTEVNGDMLQVLGRVHAMTGEKRYLDQLVSIADAYCLEVIPGTGGIPSHRWDFAEHKVRTDTFNLNDHGNEIILGLSEAFIAAKRFRPEAAARWQAPLARMFRRLMDKCRHADGLWVGQVKATTGAVENASTPDTWGYALAGVVAFAEASGDQRLLREAEAMLHALRNPRYTHWNGADAYADSIEGAVLLANRFPSVDVDRWLNLVLPVFLACQRDDGIVEGWYGDGNYARTALMVALRMTEGAFCRPWSSGLRIGAVRAGSGVRVQLRSDAPWTGRLHFDTPRHRTILRLESDYVRLNKWPEWFTVSETGRYRVTGPGRTSRVVAGSDLAAGLQVTVPAGRAVTLHVVEADPPPGNKALPGASKTYDAQRAEPAIRTATRRRSD